MVAQKHCFRALCRYASRVLLKIILYAAVFEFMFKHKTPKKVIINEYLLASEHFLEKIQVGYLNAILDKIAKELRKGE